MREQRQSVTSKRKKIAAKAVEGKPVYEIAAEIGLSRERTSQHLHHPETQQFIRDAMRPHRERLERIAERSIAVVERALADDSEDRAQRIQFLRQRIEFIHEALCVSPDPDTWMLRELREHEKQLRDELNDFTPNLKAVERARDLLEMAEGRKQDGDGSTVQTFVGIEEALVLYRKLTLETRSS